ncbi:class C beta-lactamase [Pseudomonas sp. UBA4194]|uniref:class C beta-lactamase n=1 Tax=Pseudomonas sp. UBA4194 TaxID=1947317 RepID=UPI0025D509E8|nr:class C beta-lactamase [Pseudomonas sp. UBA4194]
MHLSFTRLATALVIACTAPLVCAAQPSGLDNQIAIAARKVMAQYNIAGLGIAITDNGQQRFYPFGVASRETNTPVSADTLFELGSISKTFTATLATYAQAQGKLSLDDHPGKYLEPLRGTPLDNATVADLGTHSAGGFPLQLPDEVQTDSQLMTYFAQWQPSYAPGTHRTYANPSIGLLGVIAAKSLHMPFREAMQTTLFPALGLSHTYLQVPPAQMHTYAQGYDKQDQPVRLNPAMLADEAYGVKSNLRDLARYLDASMGLVPVEPVWQKALDATHVGYFKVGPFTQALIWEEYGYPVAPDVLIQGNSNAMAYDTHPTEPLRPLQLPQANTWVNKTGATNGFGAYVAFVPARKQGIVILANKNYPNEARVRLAYQILGALDK